VVTLLNSVEDHRKVPSVAAALKRRRQLVHALANREALIKEGREEIEWLCETLSEFRADLTQALKRTPPR
jgi:hypothetical protein